MLNASLCKLFAWTTLMVTVTTSLSALEITWMGDPDPGAATSQLNRIYVAAGPTDRYFTEDFPSNQKANIIATVEDTPRVLTHDGHLTYLFSTEDTTYHRLANQVVNGQARFPTLASPIADEGNGWGVLGSDPALGWAGEGIDWGLEKVTRGVLNLGLGEVEKRDGLLTVPSVHFDRIPRDARLLDRWDETLTDEEKMQRGRLLTNPWTFIYHGVQSAHVLEGATDAFLLFSHTENANDARTRLSRQAGDYRARVEHPVPWGYWILAWGPPQEQEYGVTYLRLEEPNGDVTWPRWDFPVDNVRNWFWLDGYYEPYYYQNILAPEKPLLTNSFRYAEWQFDRWSSVGSRNSPRLEIPLGWTMRHFNIHHFHGLAYNEQAEWYADAIEVNTHGGAGGEDGQWLEAGYTAFVTYAMSPLDATSGVATSTLDYGPCVWPERGFFGPTIAEDGLLKIDLLYEGVAYPTSLKVEQAGTTYIYLFYHDHSGPETNKVARAELTGSGADAQLSEFYNWDGGYDADGQPTFTARALPVLTLGGLDLSLRQWLAGEGEEVGYPRVDLEGLTHLDTFRLFMATPPRQPSPALNLPGSGVKQGLFNVVKVRGYESLYLSVENRWIDGVVNYYFRLSENLVDWSEPYIIPSEVDPEGSSDQMVFTGFYPQFLSADGLSQTEVDLDEFYLLAMVSNNPIQDTAHPAYNQHSWNQMVRLRCGLRFVR